VGLERRDMIGGDRRDMKEQVCEGERGTRGEHAGPVVLYSGDHGAAVVIGTMGCEERILERWITMVCTCDNDKGPTWVSFIGRS